MSVLFFSAKLTMKCQIANKPDLHANFSLKMGDLFITNNCIQGFACINLNISISILAVHIGTYFKIKVIYS